MKITDSWLVDFIEVKEQGRIPIFQRSYSWKTEHCIRLVEDIITVGKSADRDCHFLGSIIYENTGRESGVAIKHIIDGQQRLTTVSLLMLALLDFCGEYYTTQTEESEEIINQLQGYLFNDVTREDLRKKLLFNGDADFEYQALITNRTEGCRQTDSKYVINYRSILKLIRQKKVSPKVYVEGIQKLKIVDILVEEKDDAHLIFETVNGTGLDLTGAELIKNYILMTVLPANQNNLYTDSWRPMELALGSDFDKFFRYYLITVTREEMENNPKKCYENFKRYAQGNNTEELVRKEICKYYKCYERWNNATKWSTDRIDAALYRLKYTGNQVITPVVLLLLFKLAYINESIENETDADKKKELRKDLTVKEKETVSILALLEAYFVRFRLCEIDSKNIGDAWLKMLKALSNDCTESSLKSVIAAISTTNQHMPTDAELDEHLKVYNIYHRVRWCRYILDRIEKHLNKDYTHDSQWSIEHILPQTPKTQEDLDALDSAKKSKYDWISALGTGISEAMLYVHTIGNLTLSGYNSDYQNFAFLVKRDMGSNAGEEKKGYKFSTIHMTEYLKDKDEWNKDKILERTEYMGKQIKNIWPYPVF